MAYDEGLAEMLRGDLAEQEGIAEKKMFGGIAFMLHGNVICGVHKNGGMFRVGEERQPDALTIEGVGPMMFTGRAMKGWLDVTDDLMADDTRRARIMEMALACVRELPPK